MSASGPPPSRSRRASCGRLAVAPDEQRRRHHAPAADLARGLAVTVEHAREAGWLLVDEAPCGIAAVGGVQADEGDLVTVLLHRRCEERELEAARAAPRCPLVDHDRVALERRQPGLEVAGSLAGDVLASAALRASASAWEAPLASTAAARALRFVRSAAGGQPRDEHGGDQQRASDVLHGQLQDGESAPAGGGWRLRTMCTCGAGGALSLRAAHRPRCAAARRRRARS